MHGVRDLRDIPLLFVEGEKTMGGTRKSTPEKLNQIIQFIWDYQDKHDGETPNGILIAKHVGIAYGGISYWLSLLIEQGRLNKISPRPFRVTITDHKENKRAIDRFKLIRQRQEEAEARERDQIRQQQETDRNEQQLHDDKAALFEATASPPDTQAPAEPDRFTTVATLARPAIADIWARQAGTAPTAKTEEGQRIDEFSDAHARVRAVNKEVRAMMPRLLKIADERDLVFELVTRGYTVSKVR